MDVVFLREPVKRCDEGSPIVSNNFLNTSPSAKDFLEEKRAQGASSFLSQHSELWPIA
jgi:hypothetical protein